MHGRGRFIDGSSASLHAKTLAIDAKTLLVGSFDMDPRAAAPNTETSLALDHSPLAGPLAFSLKRHRLTHTHALGLDRRGRLQWQIRKEDMLSCFDTQPQSDRLTRFFVWFCSLLPIEWQL